MKFGQFSFSIDFRVKRQQLLHHHSTAKPSLVTTVKAKVPYRSSKIMNKKSIFKEKNHSLQKNRQQKTEFPFMCASHFASLQLHLSKI